MLCPKCGTKNTDQAEVCTNCNESLLMKSEQAAQPGANTYQHITDLGSSSDPVNSSDKTTVSKGLYIGILVITLIFPIIGILMGFTYIRKGYPSTVNAGKHWLIFAGFIIFIQIIIIVTMYNIE